MSDPDAPVVSSHTLGFKTRFPVILGSFSLFVAISLPILLSFDLWVFKDRSSFLNLDYLIEKHYRLGIDAFYAYGLLPVYIQHILFQIFGRGYQPMIGCTLVVLVLTALFWALLLGQLPGRRAALWGVVAISPVILSINPNFPYSIVVLSIEFALYFVLRKRLDLALACAVVGCFCVPSLPLVLTATLVFCILAEWWFTTERRLSQLSRKLLPGLFVYAVTFAGLSLFFGFPSMLITALPILGSSFYKANGMGKLSALMEFIHPPGHSLKYYCAYYVFSLATWFILSTLTIWLVGVAATVKMVRSGRIDYRCICVVLYGTMHMVFLFFAYGNGSQHGIYEPVLAAATLVAIFLLPKVQFTNAALVVFVALGVIGEAGRVHKTWVAWRTTAVVANSDGLYSDPLFAADLANIVGIAKDHRLLMLSYATGVHHYFPDIRNPDVWFLYPGQFLPSDRQRMLDQIDRSDVIVEDLTSPNAVVNYDSDVRIHMAHMHESGQMRYFRIWQRDGTPPIKTTLR